MDEVLNNQHLGYQATSQSSRPGVRIGASRLWTTHVATTSKRNVSWWTGDLARQQEKSLKKTRKFLGSISNSLTRMLNKAKYVIFSKEPQVHKNMQVDWLTDIEVLEQSQNGSPPKRCWDTAKTVRVAERKMEQGFGVGLETNQYFRYVNRNSFISCTEKAEYAYKHLTLFYRYYKKCSTEPALLIPLEA